jgi:hypothetical protein
VGGDRVTFWKAESIRKFLDDLVLEYRDWVLTDSDEDFNIRSLRDKYPEVRVGVRRALLYLKRQGRL